MRLPSSGSRCCSSGTGTIGPRMRMTTARLMGLRSARVTHSSELGFALSGERDLPSLTSNAHLCWLPGRRGESNRPTSVCAGSTGCRNLQAARDANHFHDCAHPPEERECCPRDPHRTLVIDPLTNMGLCLVLVQPCTTGAMFLTPLKGLSRRAVKVVLSEPRHPRRLTKPSAIRGGCSITPGAFTTLAAGHGAGT